MLHCMYIGRHRREGEKEGGGATYLERNNVSQRGPAELRVSDDKKGVRAVVRIWLRDWYH